jgi:hypothetical protein
MARRVKVMPIKRRNKYKGYRIYPWDKWSDGSTWKVKQGTDFDISIRNFQIYVHQAAAKRGLKVQTYTDGDALYFQFYNEKEMDNESILDVS